MGRGEVPGRGIAGFVEDVGYFVFARSDPADIRRVAGCRCEATLIPFVKEAALPNFLSPRASRLSMCVSTLRPQRNVTAGVRRAKLIMIADR
jgi:hypothetical protein